MNDCENNESSENDDSTDDASDLPAIAREVEEFVGAAGWNQPPQLFALVPTAELLRQQPGLADQLNAASNITPVAQEALPEGDLAESLGRIAWPETVQGCALAQEIIVLPPDAESELPDTGGATDTDAEQLRHTAAAHPRRTEARLVAAVLRDGTTACVMRLREVREEGDGVAGSADELLEHPELAPNLVQALSSTFLPE